MQFFSEPGFTLPEYAHPDEAFQVTLPIAAGASSTVLIDRPGGEYIDILLHLSFNVTTAPINTERVVEVSVFDSATRVLYALGASPYPQPQGTASSYIFSTSFGTAVAAVGTGTTVVQAPLAQLLIVPPFTAQLTGIFWPQGDRYDTITAQLLRIPTGPVGTSTKPPALAATPVLV